MEIETYLMTDTHNLGNLYTNRCGITTKNPYDRTLLVLLLTFNRKEPHTPSEPQNYIH